MQNREKKGQGMELMGFYSATEQANAELEKGIAFST